MVHNVGENSARPSTHINLHKTVDIIAKISYNKRGNWERRNINI